MQIGIAGLPFSGKSTLFDTLLTHKTIDENRKYKTETERGIIKVPDERLDKLTEIFNPEKKVNATIEYIKVPGIEKDSHKGSGLPAQFLTNIKTVDTILLVIRNFENDMYPHPLNSVNPQRDIDFINTEFLLSDLAIIENRVEKLEKLIMKTQQDRDKRELSALKKCKQQLEGEKPLRELNLDDQEEMLIKGFQFISAKPILYVINIAEDDISKADEIVESLQHNTGKNAAMTALSAEIEKEISLLSAEDAKDFLDDLGIQEPATAKLIRESYQLLGLQSFFTFNDDECRSWTIEKGTNAHKAAGVIHSDMEKGFIRAEVIHFDDLIQHGSWNACKEKGLLRLEGKDYQVRDGDIISVRFNV